MARKNKKMQEEQVNLNEDVSIHYKKFFAKFADIETLPVEKWSGTQLIGYFCKLYKQHYGQDFTFKFNNPSPSKSFEAFQMRKLANSLSKDPAILKDYIDWWFKTKIIQKKKRITSMAFMTDANVVNEFKLLLSRNGNINRDFPLPSKYLQLLPDIGITTYGHLAFAWNNLDNEYKDKLRVNGFDPSVLKGIK